MVKPGQPREEAVKKINDFAHKLGKMARERVKLILLFTVYALSSKSRNQIFQNSLFV